VARRDRGAAVQAEGRARVTRRRVRELREEGERRHLEVEQVPQRGQLPEHQRKNVLFFFVHYYLITKKRL